MTVSMGSSQIHDQQFQKKFSNKDKSVEALDKSYAETEKSYQQILMTVMKNQIPGDDNDPMKLMQGIFNMIAAGQQSKQTHILQRFENQFGQLLQVSMGNYIGRQVGYESHKLMLKDEPRDVIFNMPASVKNAKIEVLDRYDRPVKTQNVATNAGVHHFTWDGNDDNGQAMPQGEYHVRVTALNHSGQESLIQTIMVGRVDEVSVNKEGQSVLVVDNQTIAMNKIRSSRESTGQLTPELIQQLAQSARQPQIPGVDYVQQAIAAYQSPPTRDGQAAINAMANL